MVEAKLASILARLDIRPVDLGLELRAVYENGMIYESKLLAVDQTQYIANLTTAVQKAFNLSINSAYPAKPTIGALLTKAASQSRNLAINAELIIPDIIDVLLSKANAQMISLAVVASQKDANAIGGKLKEKLAAAPKAEKKPEAAPAKVEKKKEAPKETDIQAGLGSLFG